LSVVVVHPIQNRDVDISSAESYGDLVMINSRYIFIDEVEDEQLPQPFVNNMLRAVDKFDPEEDYLLIAGDHLQLLVMSALLATRWGRFKVLRYDREAKGYAPIEINTE
jgi:hypothetical protein